MAAPSAGAGSLAVGGAGSTNSHTAFYLVDVVSMPEPATCLTCADDLLFVGTANGNVHRYTVAPMKGASGKAEYMITHSVVVSVGKRVTQIEALPEIDLLLVLVDGGMKTLTLRTLSSQASTLDTKNVNGFVVSALAYPKYAVALLCKSNKRVRIFNRDMDGKYSIVNELDAPETLVSVAYSTPHIYMGYSKEYNIVEDHSGVVSDAIAVRVGTNNRAFLKCMPQDTVLLTTTDSLGVITNSKGQVLGGGKDAVPGIRFKHSVRSVALCFPYLLSTGTNAKGDLDGRIEVHAARGSGAAVKYEFVQEISAPGAMALHDGRVGFTFLHNMDPGTGKGRNAVYVAFERRICRLQPVPVERQVDEMISRYQIVPACELLMGTCPDDAVLSSKLDRLHLDAGRMLLLGLHFEAAFAHFAMSTIDPRELIGMFRSLVLSTEGVKATFEGGRENAVPEEVVVRAYCYPPVYMNRDATMKVLHGTVPSTAIVGDVHDASISPADIGNYDTSRLVHDPEDGKPVSPGVIGVAADVEELISAGLPAYAKRPYSEDVQPAGLTASEMAERASVKGRWRKAQEHMLLFLRQRRVRIYAALRARAERMARGVGVDAGGRVADGGEGEEEEEAAVALPPASAARANAFAFSRHRDEYGRAVKRLPLNDLYALALAVDTAILRLLLVVDKVHVLDRLVFTRGGALDVHDTAAFLRQHGLYHSLALFYVGRGMMPEAMAVWFDLSRQSEAALVGPPSRTAIISAAAAKHPSQPLSDGKVHVEEVRTGGHGGRAGHGGHGGGRGGGRPRVDSLSDEEGGDVVARRGGRPGGRTGLTEGHPAGGGASSLDDGDEVDMAVAEDVDGDATAPPSEFGTVLYHGPGGPRTVSRLHSTINPRARYPPSFFAAAAEGEGDGSGGDRHYYTGIDDAIEVLRRERDSSTVFRYAEWLLLLAPGHALTIFTAPLVRMGPTSRVPLAHHNPDQVLQYLRRPLLAEASRQSAAAAVVRLYLEHLVYDRRDETTAYHTALAREYVDNVLKYDRNSGQPPLFTVTTGGGGGHGRGAELAELARYERSHGTHRQRCVLGEEPGMVGEFRCRLMHLLQDSPHVDAGDLLRMLEATLLFEEKVVLHARRGNHIAALDLLVHDLADFHTAVHYCLLQPHNHMSTSPWAAGGDGVEGGVDGGAGEGEDGYMGGGGVEGGEPGESVPRLSRRQQAQPFLVLLHLYLMGGDVPGVRRRASSTDGRDGLDTRLSPWDNAITLLTDYAHAFNPDDVAGLLPPSLPLHKVHRFWEIAAPTSTHTGREASMVSAIYRHLHIATHDALIDAQGRHVVMTRTTYCGVCDKRMGDAVFAVLPNNRPVHFKCLQELGTSAASAALGRGEADYGARRLGFAPGSGGGGGGGGHRVKTLAQAFLPDDINPSTGMKADAKATLRATVATASPGYLPIYDMKPPGDGRRYVIIMSPRAGEDGAAGAPSSGLASIPRASMKSSRAWARSMRLGLPVAGGTEGRAVPVDEVATVKAFRWTGPLSSTSTSSAAYKSSLVAGGPPITVVPMGGAGAPGGDRGSMR